MISSLSTGRTGPVSWLATCSKYGSEILFVNTLGELMCYYHKTNTIKLIQLDSEGRWIKWFSYEPSLVFLQGMKPFKYGCFSQV